MNLCCGASNQTGTRIIAILELLLAILLLVIGILGCLGGAGMMEMAAEDEPPIPNLNLTPEEIAVGGMTGMVFSVFLTFLGVLCLLFAVLLLAGANNRNRCLCMLWFIVNIIGYLAYTIGAIWEACTIGWSAELIGDALELFVQGFCLAVVWEFMKELKHSSASSSGSSYRV